MFYRVRWQTMAGAMGRQNDAVPLDVALESCRVANIAHAGFAHYWIDANDVFTKPGPVIDLPGEHIAPMTVRLN